MEGHWVLGMIEEGSEDFRMVLCPANKRDAITLLPLIQERVEEGTFIHTDKWGAYNGLSDIGYFHEVVNHSDPEHRFVCEYINCIFMI